MGNEGVSHCTGTLGRQGDLMGISGNYSTISRLQEPNYVINFIDRRLEKVTFFNLKNYRSELVRSRKHRFLTNLCRNVNQLPDAIGVDYSFSRGYFNQNHTQFNDLSITINNKNGEAIDEILINLHQATDRFRTSGSGNQHTFGLRKKGDFIFSHNYGSNALKARQSDYLGTRNIMGHLIDENKKPYYRLNCNFPGLWAELPAFSIISNYEYHLVLQLDRDVLRDLSSAQIKYVSPQSSTELMDHHKD
tara:strand:- start:45 stop:788 length:744 start_codon:yes stop_codon:yes gene_type:complete